MREQDVINNIIIITILFLVFYFGRKPKVSQTAFGTTIFATENLMRRWHMFGQYGLVLGRTVSGALIRIPHYCHVLLIGRTGGGKGVSLIIPNLLDYNRGSVIIFDPKSDNYAATVHNRRRKGRVIRLDPFGEGGDTYNILDEIRIDSMLIDNCKAAATAMVVFPTSGVRDPHWDEKSVQIITAVLVYICLRLPHEERNLNSLKDICSDPDVLFVVGQRLKEMGGIPGRMGSTILSLYEA